MSHIPVANHNIYMADPEFLSDLGRSYTTGYFLKVFALFQNVGEKEVPSYFLAACLYRVIGPNWLKLKIDNF